MNPRSSRNTGLALPEVLLAVTILAMAAALSLGLLRAGARGTAKAGQAEYAAMAAERALDQLLASGYDALAASAGSQGSLDLQDEEASRGLDATGKIEMASPGLVRVSVTVSWKSAGTTEKSAPRELRLFRYVADPLASLHRLGVPSGGSEV